MNSQELLTLSVEMSEFAEHHKHDVIFNALCRTAVKLESIGNFKEASLDDKDLATISYYQAERAKKLNK